VPRIGGPEKRGKNRNASKKEEEYPYALQKEKKKGGRKSGAPSKQEGPGREGGPPPGGERGKKPSPPLYKSKIKEKKEKVVSGRRPLPVRKDRRGKKKTALHRGKGRNSGL